MTKPEMEHAPGEAASDPERDQAREREFGRAVNSIIDGIRTLGLLGANKEKEYGHSHMGSRADKEYVTWHLPDPRHPLTQEMQNQGYKQAPAVHIEMPLVPNRGASLANRWNCEVRVEPNAGLRLVQEKFPREMKVISSGGGQFLFAVSPDGNHVMQATVREDGIGEVNYNTALPSDEDLSLGKYSRQHQDDLKGAMESYVHLLDEVIQKAVKS